MRIEQFPYNFDVMSKFPAAVEFRCWEGGGAYQAERDGKSYIIIDEGTMADFMDENDPRDLEAMSRLVSVMEFDNQADRDEYIRTRMKFGVDPSTLGRGKDQ